MDSSNKRSENYYELEKSVKNTFNGKKKYLTDKESIERAWKLLKRLIKKYGYLLKAED